MTMKDQADIILREVAKGLKSVVVPPKKDEKPDEFLQLHYCPKCKKYHKAE